MKISTVTELVISVGRLSSIPELIGRIPEQLQEFTSRWRSHANTQVVWDLRYLQAGTISPAAVAAFCACACRLREFAWTKPMAVAPAIEAQRFLYGIGFFELVREYDLMDFEVGAIGGFKRPTFHPTTQIFSMRRIPEAIPPLDHPSLGAWKDQCREAFRQEMLYHHNCDRLFRAKDVPRSLAPTIVNGILNCCAEFATNAVLWGRSNPFIALQVSKQGFSASVCDVGDGLRQSLCQKSIDRLPRQPNDDHEATLFASVFNRNVMGLYHTISNVLGLGGKVTISAGNSEIHWRPALWRRVQATIDANKTAIFDVSTPRRLLGPVIMGRVEASEYSEGIRREWNPGLRGTRIEFQVPFK